LTGFVMGTAEILELQALCRRIFIEDSVRDYIVAVNSSTRNHKDVKLGTSTRCAFSSIRFPGGRDAGRAACSRMT
jgi:MoxR-like ATPase